MAGQAPDSERPLREPLPGLQILIVEDVEAYSRILAMLLEHFGHQVTTAKDGVAGIAALKATPPDVVLLDIGLPGMNGYEVARQIRQLSDARPPYLIALTGFGQDADRRNATEAGFDLHLLKPVHAQQLETVLYSFQQQIAALPRQQPDDKVSPNAGK